MFLTRVFSSAAHDDEHVGVKPIIQGYLLKKSKSSNEFKTKYFSLFPDANLVYYHKRGGPMKGVMKLTEDFYVSDHRMHPFGFQISDLNETFYLAAADNDSKMFWMHTIAGVLRRLAKAGAEALPPQYSEVLMTKVIPNCQPAHDPLEDSRVNIYHDQTPEPPPPPPPLGPPPLSTPRPEKPAKDCQELVNARSQLADALAAVEDLRSKVREVTREKEHEAARSDEMKVERDRVRSELMAAKSKLREADARVASLEMQLEASQRTGTEERRQEVQRVQKAVEAEWSAKLVEAKRKAESDLRVVSTEKAVLSSEKAALAVEVEELKRKLATIVAAVTPRQQQAQQAQQPALLPRTPPAVAPQPFFEAKPAPQQAPPRAVPAPLAPAPQPPQPAQPQQQARPPPQPQQTQVQPPTRPQSQQVPPQAQAQAQPPSSTTRPQSQSRWSVTSASRGTAVPVPPRPLAPATTTNPTPPAPPAPPAPAPAPAPAPTTTVTRHDLELRSPAVSAPATRSPARPVTHEDLELRSPVASADDPKSPSLDEPQPLSGSAATAAGGPQRGSMTKALAAHWASKSAAADASAKTNPFSKNFDANATKGQLQKGVEGYGRPPPGSKSEERAIRAQEWVETEIDKLLAVINSIGTKDDQGRTVVKFGPLFVAYQDISDTLVGILMRAKKKKRIAYNGDMLWQGCDDEVTITVIS